MSDITAERKMIQNEETAPQAAVSESTMTRVGAAINFINTKQDKQFYFGAGGAFSNLSTPYTDLGAQEVFNVDSEITNLGVRFGEAGSAGTTEFDIKWRPADDSAAWASIFSTTPKVANTAPNNSVFDANAVSPLPSGCTAPVLSKTVFDAGDKLRCDLITTATGARDNIMIITFRPTTI